MQEYIVDKLEDFTFGKEVLASLELIYGTKSQVLIELLNLKRFNFYGKYYVKVLANTTGAYIWKFNWFLVCFVFLTLAPWKSIFVK